MLNLVIILTLILIGFLLKKQLNEQKQQNQQQNREGFENNNSETENIKVNLMSILNVSNDRIQNIKVTEETDESSFQIEFEVLPRKLGQDQQPILKEIKEELGLKVSNLNFPIITDGENQKTLANFEFQEIPLTSENNQEDQNNNTNNTNNANNTIDNNQNKKDKKQYINPSYQPQIKYLKYLESGFHHDPEIDRTYKLNDKAKIYLEPLPTF